MEKTNARDVWARLGGFVLDFRLALRMLARYPLLTIVGVAGMAFGLAAAISGLEVRAQMIDPRLPLEDGGRIVGLRNWDVSRDRPGPVSDADLSAWREQLQRVEGLGAVVLVERSARPTSRRARRLWLSSATHCGSDDSPGTHASSAARFALASSRRRSWA